MKKKSQIFLNRFNFCQFCIDACILCFSCLFRSSWLCSNNEWKKLIKWPFICWFFFSLIVLWIVKIFWSEFFLYFSRRSISGGTTWARNLWMKRCELCSYKKIHKAKTNQSINQYLLTFNTIFIHSFGFLNELLISF